MMRVVTERVSKTIGATAIHEVFLLMSKVPTDRTGARKSSQMASMIWIFRSIGSALISSAFMRANAKNQL